MLVMQVKARQSFVEICQDLALPLIWRNLGMFKTVA